MEKREFRSGVMQIPKFSIQYPEATALFTKKTNMFFDIMAVF
jgi:hypothetical protein